MISTLIYTYLGIISVIYKTKAIIVPTEDLIDEYYTIILKPNSDTIPQDDKDAQDIMDSDRREDVIASILPYRDKIRRFAINQRMLTKIHPRITFAYLGQYPVEDSDQDDEKLYTVHYWVTKWYPPQRSENSTYTFMDLCFGLLEDENVVLGQYLNNFFYAQDETWIIIGMVLTKDMRGMITTFDNNHRLTDFKALRKLQRHPFENMLRVWVSHNRDPIEAGESNRDDIVKDANALKAEYDSGSWRKKKRDQLELILMYKSIKYARAVITEFETIMGNKPIETIINDCIQNHIQLNHDLADVYSSLGSSIHQRQIHLPISPIFWVLGKYSDSKDYWAAWIMCIAVLRPQEWPMIDLVFQKNNNGDSLSKFIMEKLTTDKVMAEMIAVIVDSNFKPTTFSEKPAPGGQGESSVPFILPPVLPTVISPAPSGSTPAPEPAPTSNPQ